MAVFNASDRQDEIARLQWRLSDSQRSILVRRPLSSVAVKLINPSLTLVAGITWNRF